MKGDQLAIHPCPTPNSTVEHTARLYHPFSSEVNILKVKLPVKSSHNHCKAKTLTVIFLGFSNV